MPGKIFALVLVLLSAVSLLPETPAINAAPVFKSATNTAVRLQPPAVQDPSPAPSPTPSQAPAQEPIDDVVRITSQLVQLDVVVTDKSGKQVTDLKTEDFEVFEDGHTQPITHFSYVPTGPATGAPATVANAAGCRRKRGRTPLSTKYFAQLRIPDFQSG